MRAVAVQDLAAAEIDAKFLHFYRSVFGAGNFFRKSLFGVFF